MRLCGLVLALLLAAGTPSAAAKRVLLLTATAGFRHVDSIAVEIVLEAAGQVSNTLILQP